MIDSLKKIFKIGPQKRAERIQLQDFQKIIVTIQGVKFRVHDFSDTGLALLDQGLFPLAIGKVYQIELSAYQKRCNIKAKAVRRQDNFVGFQVLDLDTYREFEANYLKSIKT